MKEKTKQRTKEIPESKKKLVKEIADAMKKNTTIMLASVKGLPSRQFQSIRSSIRDKASIKTFKKSIILRAIESSSIKSISNLKDYVHEDSVVILSDLDAFELSSMLSDKKSPAKAKIGQIANEEIKIEPGPTDIPPGPAISEFGSLGIKVSVEDGKIAIKEPKVIVKKGEPVTEKAAGIMTKLDIKPFTIGFEPIAAYDLKENKLYTNLKIDKKAVLSSLLEKYSRALAFAVSLTYLTNETVKFILAKAASHEKALEKFLKVETSAQSASADSSAQTRNLNPEVN